MTFLKKFKLYLFKEISFIKIAIVLSIFYPFINTKTIDTLIIPGIITFLAYKLIKNKLLKKYSIFEGKNKNNLNEIENFSSVKAKNISYKIGFFIYLFYIEFYFFEIPKIKFLQFSINSFIIFYIFFIILILYLKLKKTKQCQIYIYTYLYYFLFQLISKILKIIK